MDTQKRTINNDRITAFKRTWPAHGFPDDLAFIEVEYEPEIGDICDFAAYSWQGDALEGFDGPALDALLDEEKARWEAGLWFCVGFYERDMGYGGSEEGGWWYEAASLVRPFRYVRGRAKAEALCNRANRTFWKRAERLRYSISSVCYAGGAYEAKCNIGHALVTHYPTRRPHYE